MVSSWTANDKDWKALWKIKAPGKMIIHLWRFIHDCLPSGLQLCRRHIPAVCDCIFCGRDESIEHSMLFCQFARVVWREIKQLFPRSLLRKDFTATKFWLFDFLARSNEQQATVLAVTFWHIWEARNEARNSKTKPNPSRTAGKIIAYVNLIQQQQVKQGLKQRRVSQPSSIVDTAAARYCFSEL
jgi:hypothetical protein